MLLSKFLTTTALLTLAPLPMAAINQDVSVVSDTYFNVVNNAGFDDAGGLDLRTGNPMNLMRTPASVLASRDLVTNMVINENMLENISHKNAIINLGNTGEMFAAASLAKSAANNNEVFGFNFRNNYDTAQSNTLLTKFGDNGQVLKTNAFYFKRPSDGFVQNGVISGYTPTSDGAYVYATVALNYLNETIDMDIVHTDGTTYDVSDTKGKTERIGSGLMVIKIDTSTLRVVEHVSYVMNTQYGNKIHVTLDKNDTPYVLAGPYEFNAGGNASFYPGECNHIVGDRRGVRIIKMSTDLSPVDCFKAEANANNWWSDVNVAGGQLADGRFVIANRGMAFESKAKPSQTYNHLYNVADNQNTMYHSILLSDGTNRAGIAIGEPNRGSLGNHESSGFYIQDVVTSANEEWIYFLINSKNAITGTEPATNNQWTQHRGGWDTYLTRVKTAALSANSFVAGDIMSHNLGGNHDDFGRKIVLDDATDSILVSMETNSNTGPIGTSLTAGGSRDVAIAKIDSNTFNILGTETMHLGAAGQNEYPELVANDSGVYLWWMNHNGGANIRQNGGTANWDPVLGKIFSIKRSEAVFTKTIRARGYSINELVPSWRGRPTTMAQYQLYADVDTDETTLETYVDYLAWKANWLFTGQINTVSNSFGVAPSQVQAVASNKQELEEYISQMNFDRGTHFELPEIEHEPMPESATHLGSSLNWTLIGIGGSLAMAYIALILLNKKNKEQSI